MKKRIILDLEFKDDFVPPDRYEEPCNATDWHSQCDDCPFHVFSDDYGGTCCLNGWDKCPIKEFF